MCESWRFERPPRGAAGAEKPRRACTLSADDLFGLEEEVDLDLGVFGTVRAVDAVGLDRLGEGLADRPLENAKIEIDFFFKPEEIVG